MGAVADWRRVRRLGRYLVRDRRRLLVALLLLLPLAFAGALQPVLLGQAVSVLRGEPSLPFLSGLSLSASIRVIIGLYFVSVLLRLGLQGVQQFSILAVGQRLTAESATTCLNMRCRFPCGFTTACRWASCSHGSPAMWMPWLRCLAVVPWGCSMIW